jgi:hypothetical protein
MTVREREVVDQTLREEGSALIVALLATTLLLVMGSALALVAQTESAIAATSVLDAQTLSAAEAALRHATADLEELPDWTTALSGAAVSPLTDGASAAIRTVGRTVIDLTALGATLNASAAALPFGANNPQWTLFLWGPGQRLLAPGVWAGYVAVWIADDPMETDDNPQLDGGGLDQRGRGVMRLRAEAFDTLGAHRIVEATAVRLVSGRVRLFTRQGVR